MLDILMALHRVRERSQKMAQIHVSKAVIISLSQVFFVFGIILLVLAPWLGSISSLNYGLGARSAYLLAGILSIVVSYLLFAKVDEIDFFDFLASMVVTGALRSTPHGRFIDGAAAQLLIGLILIALAPVVLSLKGTVAGGLTLAAGGVFLASAAVGYYLAHWAYSKTNQ